MWWPASSAETETETETGRGLFLELCRTLRAGVRALQGAKRDRAKCSRYSVSNFPIWRRMKLTKCLKFQSDEDGAGDDHDSGEC